MTYRKAILNYMKDNGSITNFDAYRDLGITCLVQRVHDLRRAGYSITSQTERRKNAAGHTVCFARYFLQEEKPDAEIQATKL